MISFSLEMIPTLIFIVVFFSSNIFIFQFDIARVSAAPVNNEANAMEYLAKYGYMQITEEEIKNGTSISKEAMTEALKEYQKFNNLEVTGNLDVQTVNKMQQPRCAEPDEFPDHLRKKRFVLYDDKWSKKLITFKLNNTPKHEKYDVPYSAVQSDLNRALQLWQKYIPIQLEIYNQSASEQPDVMVSFKEEKHDGVGGVLAYATYPSSGSHQNSFIQFDGEENWYFKGGKYGNGKGFSFYQTAAHEIGHTLGLKHSEDENAVMYPVIFPKKDSDFQLSSDDIQGIQTLYPYKQIGYPVRKQQND